MSRGGAKRREKPDEPGPWRTCIGCRAVRRPDDPYAGLVRFVRADPAASTSSPTAVPIVAASAVPNETPPGVVMSRHGHGRGAWICRVVLADATAVADPTCLANATKRRAFVKALRVTQ